MGNSGWARTPVRRWWGSRVKHCIKHLSCPWLKVLDFLLPSSLLLPCVQLVAVLDRPHICLKQQLMPSHIHDFFFFVQIFVLESCVWMKTYMEDNRCKKKKNTQYFLEDNHLCISNNYRKLFNIIHDV